MILLVLLAVLCRASAEPQPAIYAVDGVEGIIYEIPEYEDPELTQFRLQEMGAVPVLTILEAPEDSPEDGDSEYYEQLADVKRGLDDVFNRLYKARTKLEKGNSHITTEVMMAIQALKKLERDLRTDVHRFGTSVRQSVKLTANSDGPKFSSEGQVAFTSQTPVDVDATDSGVKNSYERKTYELPFGESVFTKETKKVEDGEKAAVRKKWTWKTSV